MKKLLILILLFSASAFAGVHTQIRNSNTVFIGGDETVYTVPTGKTLRLKTVLFSAWNQHTTSAEIHLLDSADIVFKMFIPELESGGFTGAANIPIDFDEPWVVDDNLILHLEGGNSANVGASLTVIGILQ